MFWLLKHQPIQLVKQSHPKAKSLNHHPNGHIVRLDKVSGSRNSVMVVAESLPANGHDCQLLYQVRWIQYHRVPYASNFYELSLVNDPIYFDAFVHFK